MSQQMLQQQVSNQSEYVPSTHDGLWNAKIELSIERRAAIINEQFVPATCPILGRL